MPELLLISQAWPLLRRFWPYLATAALSLLCWHFQSRAVANADAVRVQAAKFRQAQAAAMAIAEVTLHHQEAEYAAKASEADHEYARQEANAHASADAYIAAHRIAAGMRAAAAAGDASATPASAKGGSPGVPASVSGDAVVVSGGDVQACTDATTYALKAHDWANSINP